mmetsp:Transcript_1532/g.1535  ORF Transcript_1532/g.1535 Transcript_1532/m.1535 type:complete len:443 (+) Transcript_1532:37-1365(+)|eukprot:CAMPEP_0174821250 /NCGR_PEP_ID=MMETSP1107-20130205/6103_1 /TAXON_ID=36770 /ORGANISM="Paraphysomonas vestita, Strain GFlagA" /LENGTH=442 /DNA_ID=CAMNT_0016038075 /DNA_START=28 /DNA_END=1356 /DNA_ORIENTATION=+
MNKTKKEIESLLMPPAGISTSSNLRGSTSDCMIFTERPTTPENIKKYRKSTNLEPGKRYQNPKNVIDNEVLKLDTKTFGITSRQSDTNAAELLKQTPPNGIVGKLNFVKAENIYYTTKREPLGQVYTRHHQLPSKYTEGTPFGQVTKSQEDTAKNLLFPRITEAPSYADEMYKKSHGTYGVGEQKTRNYDWKIDPTKTTFGMKGKDIAFNGVSKNISDILTTSKEENGPLVVSSNVENFKDLGDTLGRPRNLGIGASTIPPETVFGRPSISIHETNLWGAAETIRGNYGDKRDDGTTVDDLGRSITPGFRNITTETRAYGVPSIRNDLPRIPHNKRSMADPMNYGDDASARELISPQDFSNLSIQPNDFHKPLSLDKIRHIFGAIGYNLPEDITQFIYDIASQGQGGCSIHQYRVVMNDYIYADETGNADDWLRANGFSRRK